MNPPDDHPAIETAGLSKHFEDQTGWRFWEPRASQVAVRDVSLRVDRGELFGLLGPNGAGKTTLVKMLCTLILPSAGTATVLGYPLSAGREIRRRVGLTVTDERSFYWRLTGRQNLRFFAGLHGLFGSRAERRINQLLHDVDLEAAADRRFSGYSTGMRQRLSIARALLPEPALLILDEPSRSLDPVSTQDLHELILRLRSQQQLTVFLITHDLAEAEKLCDRVAIMRQGGIVTQDRPQVIRERLSVGQSVKIYLEKTAGKTAEAVLSQFPTVVGSYENSGFTLSFRSMTGQPLLNQLLSALSTTGLVVNKIETDDLSLEEAFQQLVAD